MNARHLLQSPTERTRPVFRYAPSPTGDLHLGNLRTALVAHRQCREREGIFILRMEDIDRPRVVTGSARQLMDDLKWLGVQWDEGPDVGGPAGPYVQSERSEFYEAAMAALKAEGLVYPCTCSRRDLRVSSAPHGPEGPVYPGLCRARSIDDPKLEPSSFSMRLNLSALTSGAKIEFEDAAQGTQEYDLANLCGDFVIRRRDRLWAYQLACAIDDSLMGITHVLRGADLLSSTPRQLAIMRALGLPEPTYEHISLVADPQGKRMSKRDGSQSIRPWRDGGMSSEEARERILNCPLITGGH